MAARLVRLYRDGEQPHAVDLYAAAVREAKENAPEDTIDALAALVSDLLDLAAERDGLDADGFLQDYADPRRLLRNYPPTAEQGGRQRPPHVDDFRRPPGGPDPAPDPFAPPDGPPL